jgi:hypothetical protein
MTHTRESCFRVRYAETDQMLSIMRITCVDEVGHRL